MKSSGSSLFSLLKYCFGFAGQNSTVSGNDRISGSSIRQGCRGAFAALLLSALGALCCPAQVNVVTQHNDIARTGQNTSESILTPANVNSSTFGQLFALPVDGQIYAQPLYLSGLQIPGSGTHNVIFVATEHDSVYAFDANSNGGSNASPLWHASLLSTAYGAASGATTVPSATVAEDIIPEYGITGTPVIDPVAGILYVVSFTEEGANYILRLHALSVATGAEMLNGPVTIQGQVPGVGNGSSGGVLQFDARWENQRPGLLLLNGILYVGFASHADNGPWHGWILSYNATTLAQVAAFCTSPNGVGAGVWMGGDGLAADVVDPVGHPFGRMFAATGNGDYTAATPYTSSMDYGDSILNLDLTNGTPTVQDNFTPSIQATLDSSDGDLGSGGVVILPNQTTTPTYLLAQEGKGGTIYLVNRNQMGGYNATDNVVQEIASATMQNGVWGGPAYWNGNVYTGEKGQFKAYSLINGVLSAAPSSLSPETYGFPGPSPSVSSLGATNGIVWAVQTSAYESGGLAILRAYNATNLASELYNSSQVPARDSAGPADKFAVPTIANGKVYVGTGGQLDVYGLLSSEPSIAPPVITPGSTTFTGSLQVTITDATPGAAIYYTLDGSTPSTASTLYSGPITVDSTLTVTAIAVAPGYVWINPVSATFTSQDNTANPVFSPRGGTYSSSPTVTITDASSGAITYYTTDGTLPTIASTQYTAPIVVAGSETIQAIAFAPGLSGSAAVSQTYTTQSGVDFSQGFSEALPVMTFNGSTGLDDSRLQLTNGYTSDTGTAFVTSPLNIQAFTTDFLFQLSNPEADGITFTIQGDSPTELGAYGESLGYAPMAKSVAIKFDFFNDAGEGNDSTGLYINGVQPTIPAINLTNSGINLLSGDSMAVHLTYDGNNLAMTLTDQVTNATWSAVWQVNIPQIVGGNTAYVGFTGSTQIVTASQKIATWTYTATTPGRASNTATPVISPGTGAYASSQSVTLSDSTSGAAIYYTTDGTVPTTSSNLYSAPFEAASSEKIQAMAIVPGGAVSGATSATLAIAAGATTAVPNYTAANGFGYGEMILNGVTLVAAAHLVNGATVVNPSLQLTDGGLNEAHSAYFANAVNIQSFTTGFDFQMASAAAEGFTFVIQNVGLNAVGAGLGLGTGPNGVGTPIANSVAVAFDINGTAGEGANAALLYVNGAPSSLPATSLIGSGISLGSGDVIHAQITYNGTNLTLTLSDAATNTSVTAVYPVNISAAVGGKTAYVGFTGATSAAAAATQNILDWTYTVMPLEATATAAPSISPATGSFATPTAVTISDATPGAVIYYTTNGIPPTTASSVYSGPITVHASGTIEAAAQAPGDSISGAASASFTIQSPSVSYPAGFTTQGLALNGGATVAGNVLQLTDGGGNEARSAYFTSPINVQSFTTTFDFQLLNAVADGFTFVIQNQGLNALGSSGGGLGYGSNPGVAGATIGASVAVKFDIHNNSGEGNDSTGVYVNGASPTIPATNLTSTGVVLSSGHVIHAQIVYDGADLTLTLTDTTTNASTSAVFAVNIPSFVGGDTAYVGFTGGSGGSSAVQDILDWTYTPAPVAPAPSYSAGFTTQDLAFNGGATVNGTALELTDGGAMEARSAYFTSRVNVQAFTTVFDFQLVSAIADGFTFVIQNQGLNALGGYGGALGYGVQTTGTGPSIASSVAVKFDIHNNSGEGTDSTGVYTDGASPTIPATNLSATGLILSSGHVIHAKIVYDGANLTLTLTDTTTNATASAVYAINIPSVVGGNTAYVGFTGGTGGSSATQNILDWTYMPATGQTPTVTATPAMSPVAGSYSAPTFVSITDATSSAVIYYTTDGSAPTTASAVYTLPIAVNANATLHAIALASGDDLSAVATASYSIQSPSPSISYPSSSGFTKLGLALNGGATVSGNVLQLTDGGASEARSAYFTTPVNVEAFTTTFDFQLVNAVADGFTFVIQNQGPSAVGGFGAGLGYGVQPTGTGPSIATSVAVKFDIHNNSGEGNDSTGVYTDGASPTIPATNLSTTGVILSSGHVIHAQIVYNGTNLTLTLTDATTTATTSATYPVNIPSIVGGNTAYVGFTAGTGGSSATQNILDWSYTP